VARTRKLGKGSKGNPTRSRLNECIAALTGTYTFNCCCGGGVYSVTILCDKYDCNYTERNIRATTCPDDTSEPSTCVFSGRFDAREVIDLSTCDVTKMITASYDRPECGISENDFDLNLPEEKSTTPIGLQIQNVFPDDGIIDISFIRKDVSPKKASVSSSFEERRVEAIRYSDNAEEGHRLLAAASEFEMKALMETHRRYLGCESGFCDDDASPSSSSIKVMTFNTFLIYCHFLGIIPCEEYYSRQERIPKIAEWFQSRDEDVILMQEIWSFREEVVSFMTEEAGYYHYILADGTTTDGSGLAIFPSMRFWNTTSLIFFIFHHLVPLATRFYSTRVCCTPKFVRVVTFTIFSTPKPYPRVTSITHVSSNTKRWTTLFDQNLSQRMSWYLLAVI